MTDVKKVDVAPDVAIFHCRGELTKRTCFGVRGEGGRFPTLAHEILRMRGVVAVTVAPYAVAVSKAPLFDWSEIEGRVMALLSSFVMGEGKLMKGEENVTNPKERADLGGGFSLVVQENNGKFRAVVKDATGAIVERGTVVDEREIMRSRFEATTLWLETCEKRKEAERVRERAEDVEEDDEGDFALDDEDDFDEDEEEDEFD